MNNHPEPPDGRDHDEAGSPLIENENLFDEETWQQLPELLAHLPRPVTLHIWGDDQGSPAEAEAISLIKSLSRRFETIDYQLFPRRATYPFYPVIGVMDGLGSETVDHGLRLIGRPAGYQLTSLIAAIQCVAFQGQTAEARSRILLRRLASEVTLELITAADDEAGTVMAQDIFNLAVNSQFIRSFLIMGDQFPEVLLRYSIQSIPHLVINGRVHISGLVDQESILQHIVKAIKTAGN